MIFSQINVDQVTEGRRGDHDDRQQDHEGGKEECQRAEGRARVVEPAYPLCVDQLLADPQAGQEGRGHTAALAVEELDQVEVGANADDQGRPLLEGHQHRDVLAGAGGGQQGVLEAHVEQALATGGAPVRIGVDDQLRPAAQRLVAGRVHVAEDHVRLHSRLQHPVGAAVDGDDQRAHVADVGAQGLEVTAVTVAADDDQHVAVAEVGPGRRELDAAGQQIGLLAHVGDGVLGEFGKRLVDPLELLVALPLQLLDARAPDRAAARARRRAPLPTAIVIRSPSPSSSKGSASSMSTSVTPAWASSSGPAFG